MIWYGRELRNTVGNLVPDPSEPSDNYGAYVKKMREHIQIAHDITREKLKRSALRSKRYYDRKVHFKRHRAGDQVLVKDHSRHEKGTKKFQAKYEGPYWLIDQLGDVVYRVQKDEHSAAKIIHHNLLRRYETRGPVFVPEWVRRKSRYLRKIENPEIQVPTAPIAIPRANRRPFDTWAERRRKLRECVQIKNKAHLSSKNRKRKAQSTEGQQKSAPSEAVAAPPPLKRTRCGRTIVPPKRFQP